MTSIQKAAMDWEAKAIDECMKDPAYAAEVHSGKLCAACDMHRPCACDYDRIARVMRPYLDKCTRKNWRGQLILVGDIENAKSRSWGQGEPIHEMLWGLLKIAHGNLNQI